MFDAAEITKAVRNKNKREMDKRILTAFTYLGICYCRLEEGNVIYVRFTSERIMYYLGKVGQVR